jgi:hypothetical protein
MLTFVSCVFLYSLCTALCFSAMLYDWYYVHNFEITSSDLKMMMSVALIPVMNIVLAFLIFFGVDNNIVVFKRRTV